MNLSIKSFCPLKIKYVSHYGDKESDLLIKSLRRRKISASANAYD